MPMNEKHYAQMFAAQSRIGAYQSPDRLKKHSARDWGLDNGNEAIEYAYENVMDEARAGLRGVRMNKRSVPKNGTASAAQNSAGQPANRGVDPTKEKE